NIENHKLLKSLNLIFGRALSFDRWMPYIAGGVAFGNVKTSVRYEDYEDDDYIAASYSKTMTGWTLGAGVDYAVTDNLIARLEYRYTDYGHKDYTSYFDDEVSTVRNKFQTHDIRLGIAYKF
ncbi:outer membrane protein, partial [Daeguia caeni]